MAQAVVAVQCLPHVSECEMCAEDLAEEGGYSSTSSSDTKDDIKTKVEAPDLEPKLAHVVFEDGYFSCSRNKDFPDIKIRIWRSRVCSLA